MTKPADGQEAASRHALALFSHTDPATGGAGAVRSAFLTEESSLMPVPETFCHGRCKNPHMAG